MIATHNNFTVHTNKRTRNIFLFYAMALGLTILFVLVLGDLYLSVNLQPLWFVLYCFSLIIIVIRLRDGLLYEPLVLFGGAYIILMVPGTYLFESVKGHSYDYHASNLIGLGFCSFVLGLFLFEKLNRNHRNADNTRPVSLLRSAKSRDLLRVLTLFCIVATLLLFVRGGIPLLASDVDEARILLFSGVGYLGVFFIGLRVVSLAFLYDAWASSNRRKMLVSHYLASTVVLLHILTGFRATTITFIGEYLALYLMLGKGKLSLKWVALTVILALIYVGTVGAYRKGGIDMSSLKEEIQTVFISRPAMLKVILQRFDKSNYFMGKRYFQDLIKIVPGKQLGANVELKYDYFGGARSLYAMSGINPSILGEAYMNFGGMGIITVPFVLGTVLGWLFMKTQRRKSFAVCIFYVILLFSMSGAVAAGIGTVIVGLFYKSIWIVIITLLYQYQVSLTSKSR